MICDEKLKFPKYGFWKGKILKCTQRVDEVDGIMTQSEVPVQYLQGTRGEKC